MQIWKEMVILNPFIFHIVSNLFTLGLRRQAIDDLEIEAINMGAREKPYC